MMVVLLRCEPFSFIVEKENPTAINTETISKKKLTLFKVGLFSHVCNFHMQIIESAISSYPLAYVRAIAATSSIKS